MNAVGETLSLLLLLAVVSFACCEVRVNGLRYGHQGGCNYSWGVP